MLSARIVLGAQHVLYRACEGKARPHDHKRGMCAGNIRATHRSACGRARSSRLRLAP